MNIFRNSRFASVALGHLMVDTLNGARSVLFTYMAATMGLSNAALGLVTTVYLIAAALAQPIFGWVADRWGARWVVTGGILWMAGFFSISMLVADTPALILVTIGSVGSGAFHSAGAMQATLVGRQDMKGHETTAASYFFTFGQIGFFIGPLLSSSILMSHGLTGMVGVAVFAIPVAIFAGYSLRPGQPFSASAAIPEGSSSTGILAKRAGGWAIAALVIVTALQSWSQQNLATFLPKYLSDLGQPATYYGLVVALFMGGSAAGNLLGGSLADRFGKAEVITVGMVLCTVPILLMSQVGVSFWLLPAAVLSGLLTNLAFSSIVVLAQRLIPGGMALASGLALGFMFTCGALGTLVTGMVADRFGFLPVFYMTAGLALAAGLFAFGLREKKAPVSKLASAD